MNTIQVTKVNPMNYVYEHAMNDISKEVNKHILKRILKNTKNNTI